MGEYYTEDEIKKQLFRTISPEKRKRENVGRKSEYCPRCASVAYQLGREFRASNRVIAVVLGITDRTVYLWRKKYPEFAEAIDKGRERYDNYHNRARRSNAK